MFDFKITSHDHSGSARTGVLNTPHGDIKTPVFMPVGTQGSVKSVSPDELIALGTQIILGNTYHLYLRPGIEVIKRFGGLHKFIGWDKPILTDSGGFQVFSLPGAKVSDEGANFKSHLDGSTHFINPEKAMDIQNVLGADIVMAFDHCAPADADKGYVLTAANRTHAWLDRSITQLQNNQAGSKSPAQALFGIVQGGIFPDLRRESAKYIVSKDLPGNAIGGLAVGEARDDMWPIVEQMDKLLPKTKPRYLMGVGEPTDLINAVSRGIDMFDCVLPTRIARTGAVFTKYGRVNLLNAKYRLDTKPIEADCACYTCQNFSTAYIRHLISAKEILGLRLTTLHNLYFILKQMSDIRSAIDDGSFGQYEKQFLDNYSSKAAM